MPLNIIFQYHVSSKYSEINIFKILSKKVYQICLRILISWPITSRCKNLTKTITNLEIILFEFRQTTIRPLPTVDDVAVGEAVAAVEAVQDVDRDLDLVIVAHVEAQRQNGRVLKGAQKGEEN